MRAARVVCGLLLELVYYVPFVLKSFPVRNENCQERLLIATIKIIYIAIP